MFFISIILMSLLSGAEVDIFIPSFPELQQVFHISPFSAELTLSVNFMAFCISALFVGNLGDRFGRKRVILAGTAIFILGSITCLSATHFWILLLGRLLQGMGVAAPSVLSYVIVADHYPISQQQHRLSIIQGTSTLAMSLAPVLGSYVSLHFHWQGNFFILLLCGLICFLCTYKWIPNDASAHASKSLSLRAYIPLIQNRQVWIYLFSMCFLSTPYWVFVGMAPIIYINDFHVPLQHFGFYQGSVTIAFACISFFSSPLIKHFGQKKCFLLSYAGCVLSCFLITCLGLLHAQNPLWITATVILLSMCVVVPINYLYPRYLRTIDGARSRLAGLYMTVRLSITSFGLQFASLVYTHDFSSTAFVMCLSLSIALYAQSRLIRKYALPFAFEEEHVK